MKPWSKLELFILCCAYARILDEERSGKRINKSAVRRQALELLDGRSAGSYELKMMNMSAALEAAHYPSGTIAGYKPYGHAQKGMAEAMKEAIARHGAQIWSEPFDHNYLRTMVGHWQEENS